LINRPGRESPGRLAGGLLEPLNLNRLGHPEEAKTRLEDFHNRIQDPWYRVISACLLDRIKEKSLAEKAGKQLAYLVTGHTALGLWAEGSDQTKQALRHYKKALGSYRDDRIEYQFAKERIKRLQARTANKLGARVLTISGWLRAASYRSRFTGKHTDKSLFH